MEITIDDKVGIFLGSNRRGMIEFSKAFSNQSEDIQRHALARGYVIRNGKLDIPYELTALGRTYAEACASRETTGA